jgi:hypothetical protein
MRSRHHHSYTAFLILSAILLLAFAVRIAGLTSQSLEYDEGYTILFAQRDLPALFIGAAQLELNTPLHYVLLHYWMILAGTSVLSTRLLSVFIGVVTVALAYTLARLAAPARPAAAHWTIILTSLFPILVAFSQETRMYGLLVCLVMLSLVTFIRALRTPNAVTWFVWGICCLAAFATHVLAVFIFAAQVIILAAWYLNQRHKTRGAIVAVIATGSLMVAWSVYLVTHAQSYGTTYTTQLQFTSVFIQSLSANLLPKLQPGGFVGVGAVLCAVIILLMVFTSQRKLAFLITCAILMVAAFCSLTGKFQGRYLAVTAPLFVTLLGIGIGILSHRHIYLSAILGGVVVLTCSIGLVAMQVDPLYANDNFRDAIMYVDEHVGSDEAILLVPGPVAPMFEYYYGPSGWYALPSDPVLNIQHSLTYDTTAPIMNQALAGKHGVWLFLSHDDLIDPSGVVQMLLRRISNGLQPEQVVGQFKGLQMLHYRFDEEYTPLPEKIPPMTSQITITDPQHGLKALGCTQFRKPHVGQGSMEVACFWQLDRDAKLPYDTQVSLRLYDSQKQLIAQSDQMLAPQKGIPYVPFEKPITSFYFIPFPVSTNAGEYHLLAIPYIPTEQISPQVNTPVIILP